MIRHRGRRDRTVPRAFDDFHEWVLSLPWVVERPYVVGESMGGWMAAEMAARRPKEIGRLALTSPVGLWRDEAPVVAALLLEAGRGRRLAPMPDHPAMVSVFGESRRPRRHRALVLAAWRPFVTLLSHRER
jgi:pimeloyl-ACP methyl ester carboxylesterase